MSADLRVEFAHPPSVVRLSPPVQRRGSSDRRAVTPAVVSRESRTTGDAVDAESEPASPSDAESADADKATAPPEWLVLQGRFLELLGAIEARVDELEQSVSREVKSIEPAVVDLAYAMARRIVGREVERGGVEITDLLQGALDRVLAGQGDRHRLYIRVSPQDRELVGRVVGERIEDSSRVEFETDPALGPMTCEIRSDMRRVRIDLEAELTRLRDALLSGGVDA